MRREMFFGREGCGTRRLHDFYQAGRHGRSFQDFGRGRGWREERGFAGRERLFEGGELSLVLLASIAEKPSYGYELIKSIEERLEGAYAPSPGVIYPTLTMLEEEGFATSAISEAGKKVFTISEAGREHLRKNQARVDAVLGRLRAATEGFQRGRSPELMKAFSNLRSAVRARAVRGNLTPEQIGKMTEAINAAAAAIDAI